ncbi:carboxylesterase family protein [Bradyrhizobium sp. Ai1a-2]|uniref:carboxylesterase/lipase family protein n=1 Tax=Bradyrhizobium sp. Ai1a-2 TaxID=196490 RepID=UPI00041215C8|nr:carboxylesterase family protein [Bradyrhizobium sp. Ai1a-2]
MGQQRKSEPLVELNQGTLRGRRANQVSTYFAIPYAAAPVGALRFAPPSPPPKREGIIDCVSPGAVAPQSPSRLRAVMGDFDARQDEDCLTLTVWSPEGGRARKPVLVWLHGGAYMSGGGALDWYSGEVLSREGDVVVVGVNYRLGALGFLYHPNVANGNMAILDQKAALEWVRDNIDRFGGDPQSVTLCGQSAGSSSIAHLLTMSGTNDLFHRCIMQSGPLGLDLLSAEEATVNAEVLCQELGIDPREPREQLRAVAADKIVSAQLGVTIKRAQMLGLKPGDQYLAFRPVADGTTLPSEGAKAFSRAARQKDVLTGWTREEFASFLAFDPQVQALERAPVPEADLKRLASRRPGASAADLLSDYLSELVFVEPTLRWASEAARAGRQAFVYAFDWKSPKSRLGACHCIELPFLFGTWDAFRNAPMIENADLHEAAKIGSRMRTAWLQFVNVGNPNAAELPTWPAFTPEAATCMRIGELFETFSRPPAAQ